MKFTKDHIGMKVRSIKYGEGTIVEFREGVMPWRIVVNFGGKVADSGGLIGGKDVLYIEDGRLSKDHFVTQDIFLI